MNEEDTTQPQVAEPEVTDLKPEVQEKPKGKTKEENFDGVVKKLNAKEKELKLLKEDLSKIGGVPNELDLVKSQLQKLVEQQNSLLMEREFDKIGISSKYAKAGRALMEEIAQDNSLDLSTQEGMREAAKIFAQEYPDLLTKKKDIGVKSGMNGNTSPALKALEGDASAFFNLSKEEKAEIARQLKK